MKQNRGIHVNRQLVTYTRILAIAVLFWSAMLSGCSRGDGESEPYVYINIFGSFTVLPNSYSIDANRTGDGVLLSDGNSAVVVGDIASRDIEELIDYVSSKKTSEYEECGVKIIKADHDGMLLFLGYSEQHYAFFTDVSEDSVNLFFQVLCGVRSREEEKSE